MRRLDVYVSVRMSVQPAGAVTVEVPRTPSDARSRSPATVPVGRARLMLVVEALLEPKLTARKAMPLPAGTSVTVQVKVSVASTAGPSRTVMDTAYGLEAAATELIVPVIRPVDVLIDSPAGRFVAAYVSGSPSGSVAPASRVTPVPSGSVRLPRFWSKVGGRFGPGTSVTVQVNVSVASTVAPSRTVIDTAYGLPAAAVELMVPVIRPVPVAIDRPGGRFVAA